MRVIRHELAITDYQTIELPARGSLLSVAKHRRNENGMIDLWSLDLQNGLPTQLGIYIVGTGNPMPGDLGPAPHFIGTVVTPIELVWHVFQGPVR